MGEPLYDKYGTKIGELPSGVGCLPAIVCTVGLIWLLASGIKSCINEFMPTSSTPQERIQQRERFSQEQWNEHNALRHRYITSKPPNLRKAMEHADIILQHSIMDKYIMQTLSDWQIDTNPSKARANLLMKAQPFPDLRFLGAASLLKIGDLYAEKGDLKTAKDFYLKVAKETSSDMSQYRLLAEERLRGLRPAVR